MIWHAVYVEPKRELFARDNLVALGLEAFCPFERTTKRVKVRNRPFFVVKTLEEPLFSRYLFVGLNRPFDVKETRGVIDLVRCSGIPLRVPEFVIARIRALADEEGCVKVRDVTKPSFAFRCKVGEYARITDNSSLDGLIVCIKSLSKLDKTGDISVWVDMLGQRRVVRVNYERLSPIELA